MAKPGIVFLDLDDTLYPKNNGVWQAVSDRIHEFLVTRLDLSRQRAATLRTHYLQVYGTTLRGLPKEHEIDPLDYLDFVHDVPIEALLIPDPALRLMLEQLVGQRIVFTNASRNHAVRVLRRLEIESAIDQIIDIQALEFVNKPLPQAYLRAMALAGTERPETCLMVDDRAENLLPAQALGMTTVLVAPSGPMPGADYVVDQITDLLQAVPGLGGNGKGQHGA